MQVPLVPQTVEPLNGTGTRPSPIVGPRAGRLGKFSATPASLSFVGQMISMKYYSSE